MFEIEDIQVADGQKVSEPFEITITTTDNEKTEGVQLRVTLIHYLMDEEPEAIILYDEPYENGEKVTKTIKVGPIPKEYFHELSFLENHGLSVVFTKKGKSDEDETVLGNVSFFVNLDIDEEKDKKAAEGRAAVMTQFLALAGCDESGSEDDESESEEESGEESSSEEKDGEKEEKEEGDAEEEEGSESGSSEATIEFPENWIDEQYNASLMLFSMIGGAGSARPLQDEEGSGSSESDEE